MNFEAYLENTRKTADEEKHILDILSAKNVLSPIEIRAAKSALQTLIENLIGKSKRVLKHYDCPVVPVQSRDAVTILFEAGAIEEDMYRELLSSIGFRNSMIHDYMQFDTEILQTIVREKRYMVLYEYLIADISYREVVIRRIENYTP